MKKRHSVNTLRRILQSLSAALLITMGILIPANVDGQTVSAAAFSGLNVQTEQTQDDPYISKFFRTGNNVNLTVFTPNGSIEVTENAALGGVQVDLFVKREFSFWRGAQSLDNYRIIIQQKDNEVIATVENKNTGSRVRTGDENQFSFQIQVPESGKMNLRTLHGPIEVLGVNGNHYLQNHVGNITVQGSEGELKVASATGDLQFEQCKGSIFAKSVSGNISVINSEGELRLRSETGDLIARDIRGTLIAATVAGDIVTTLHEVSHGVSLDTANGDIDLTLPSNIGYTISASGMNFDFSSIREFASQDKSEMMSRFMLVRDGMVPVKLTSISGKVKVTESE
ncbi:MAG: DUF4097 family beta strand repeat-containing protein [Balneolaceae bacterium]|nr:DUF4097 family beta strand repeat-containing protein [Balneolaceae bacterium]